MRGRLYYILCLILVFSVVLSTIALASNSSCKQVNGKDQEHLFNFDKPFTNISEDKLSTAYKSYSFRGFVQFGIKEDINHDRPTENELTLRNKARLEFKWRLFQPAIISGAETNSNDVTVFLSLQSDYLWFGPQEVEDDYDLDLFEAYVRFVHNPIELTIGKQIVRWGKTDQISPVDNLNPQDLREFITEDYEDRKIPIFMARLLVPLKLFTVESVYIPFFEPARIDYYGTDWAIYQHLKADAQRAPISPLLKQYVQQREVEESEPAHTLQNGEAGVRITTTLKDWDVGISYLYTWEDLPHFSSFPIKNLRVKDSASFDSVEQSLKNIIVTDEDIKVDYKRCNVAGLEFESTIGDFGIRGEFAYFSKQSFIASDLRSRETPVYHYVLGIDYAGANDWYANIQLSHQILDNYSREMLYMNKHNIFLNGKLRKGFWNGDLACRIKYNIGLSEKSYYINPSLLIKYFDNLEITLGMDILGGNDDTLLGYYDKNDQYYLKVKYIY